MRFNLAVASVLSLSVAQESLAAPKEWEVLALPATIETKQEIKATPAGWLGSIESVPNQVAGVTVFDGQPERRVSLVPADKTRDKAKNTLVHTWRLAPSSIDGSWLTRGRRRPASRPNRTSAR
ncbi:MAG: STY0301 family protein [Alphaproteobacteria bacterium]|nr:STY0301 family protein [Alphaproteobacteria bacterium]